MNGCDYATVTSAVPLFAASVDDSGLQRKVKHGLPVGPPSAALFTPCPHIRFQVVDSSKKEGGRWLRYVMARLVSLRYQTRLGVIEAGGQASRLICRNTG